MDTDTSDSMHLSRFSSGINLVSTGTLSDQNTAIAKEHPRAQQSVTVLLVDDQVTVHESVYQMLVTEADITCHYCCNPHQALQMAANLAPTVILQDLVMPEMDGITLMQQFRAEPATHDVPIVVLSSNDEPQMKAEAFALGANDYLVKLPDKIELIARIRYHSQAYRNRQAQIAVQVARAQAQELEQALQELRRTQTQLIQSEKLSSLGQMLAGIAHEINNPINFIYGNLKYIGDYMQDLLQLVKFYQQHYPEPPAAIQSFLEEISYDFLVEDFPQTVQSTAVGVDRMVQIVLSLRNFARQDSSEMSVVDLHAGIDSTLLILNHRIKQGIQVVKQYGQIPLVECYPAQLNQVFMNILSNAIDALLEQSLQLNKQIWIETNMVNNQIQIRIIDNGVGIADTIKEKLFEPFFTTKPVGKGTGLGLSICQQIINKHHGRIQVLSEPAKGTEFLIQLPIWHASKSQTA